MNAGEGARADRKQHPHQRHNLRDHEGCRYLRHLSADSTEPEQDERSESHLGGVEGPAGSARNRAWAREEDG